MRLASFGSCATVTVIFHKRCLWSSRITTFWKPQISADILDTPAVMVIVQYSSRICGVTVASPMRGWTIWRTSRGLQPLSYWAEWQRKPAVLKTAALIGQGSARRQAALLSLRGLPVRLLPVGWGLAQTGFQRHEETAAVHMGLEELPQSPLVIQDISVSDPSWLTITQRKLQAADSKEKPAMHNELSPAKCAESLFIILLFHGGALHFYYTRTCPRLIK